MIQSNLEVVKSAPMNNIETISKLINAKISQVEATVKLLDDGNTVPFISRYRKEMTGSLDDEQVRIVADEIARLRTIDDRRQTILDSIQSQGKLTDELKAAIQIADSMTRLEDLYLPYKPKKRTRAMAARENGLEPLADMILNQAITSEPLESIAEKFLNDVIVTSKQALAGARDIVAEIINDDANIRQAIREKGLKFGKLVSEKVETAVDEKAVYESYYQYETRIDRVQPHQTLAINRGEKEDILKVKVVFDERDTTRIVTNTYEPDPLSPFSEELEVAAEDSLNRLILPSIERDIRRHLTELADHHAINVFATNLKSLLLISPLKNQIVLGLDPGYRTGTKFAIVDSTGKFLESGTIYPHQPQNDWEKAKATLVTLIQKYKVTLITIGNGTASRETEKLAAEITKNNLNTKYLIVNEAGASVYSASPIARAEFPNLDVSIRGAVSIARRAQDPLSELVKIDPKSIGVGLYQHDVDQNELSASLDGVVEQVVNTVGVDVNTSSASLLRYVSGIGPKVAAAIVQHRDTNGRFEDRQQLMDVTGLGKKAFEQSAGFLRVVEGKEPLDATAIHPESYQFTRKLLGKVGLSLNSNPIDRKKYFSEQYVWSNTKADAQEIGCGEPTLIDIIEQLQRPGRDPREDAPKPILRSDIVSLDDLTEGTQLKGTVRNVVDFGAFVDIGVKQDGLLHRSQLPPGTVLKVGDIIEIRILKVEKERGRISLTLK